MEALYSKLYYKYSKLKAQKDSELEAINHDQEDKFMAYVAAADELIEHLRNENNRLHGQVNELRSEVASIRSSQDEQHAGYQKLLMEENQKNRELSEENEKLRSLQQWSHSCCERDENIENGKLASGAFEAGSKPLDHSSINMKHKRVRHSGTDKDLMVMSPSTSRLEPFPRELRAQFLKGMVCTGTSPNMHQPECFRRKVDNTDGDVAANGPASCIFQDLVEYLVGMKLSTCTRTDGVCISAVHQSSGYSFSLTWIENSTGEVELLYRVLSLGSFERVAPEWMREVLMFSTNMCPMFFDRVSRVIKLHH